MTGSVDPRIYRAVLEGRVPNGTGRMFGRRGKDGRPTTGPD